MRVEKLIKQGKHAKVKLYEDEVRVFKTYCEPVYAKNEYFALKFLAESGIMDLKPIKESDKALSMKWIKGCESVKKYSEKELSGFAPRLAAYLKNLHFLSFKKYGYYLTHEDLFADNILFCPKSDKIYFIDWGLSNKRESFYPDIASPAMGVFNESPEDYAMFVKSYFSHPEMVDFEEIKTFLKVSYDKFFEIRQKNGIETDSLNERWERALLVVDLAQKAVLNVW